MNNFSSLCFIGILAFTVIMISLGYIFSLKHNSQTNSINKKSKTYLHKRRASEQMLKSEEYIMNALKKGEIKCHKLPNSAFPYDVGKWVKDMQVFMLKPIFKQLMDLKGYETDEEHKG